MGAVMNPFTGKIDITGSAGIPIGTALLLDQTTPQIVTDFFKINTLTQGSLLFGGASGLLAQDNPKLRWVDGNQQLIVDNEITFPSDGNIDTADQTVADTNGHDLVIYGGRGKGTGHGGRVLFYGADSIDTGAAGDIDFYAGIGSFLAGTKGGDMHFVIGSGSPYGKFFFGDQVHGVNSELNFQSVLSGQVFTFPNNTGTIALTSDIPAQVYPGAGIALSTGSAWGTSIADASANWNTAYGWGNHASAGYLTGVTADSPLSGSGTSASHLTVDLSGRQPLDTGLTSLAGLTYASASFVKMTGVDTFTLDTNTYLTSVGTGVANEITYWSGTDTLGSLATATYPSLTEFSYVKGVTSAIQTQIGTKQPQLNGTGFVKATGTTISYDNSTYLTSVTAHNLLSTTHGDTTASAVARGDIIVATGVSPTWDNLAKGSANAFLKSDGTDVSWSTGFLSVAATKTLTASNTLTLTATDGSTLAIGTGGTLGTAAYTASTDYANTTLSNLGVVAINTSLVSDLDSTDNLGSATKYWSNSYIDRMNLNSTCYIDGGAAGVAACSGAITLLSDFGMVATRKIYLDGVARTGNTYISETSADTITLTSGGSASLVLTAALATVLGDLKVTGNDIKDNDGTTCITFDSGGNTTIANQLLGGSIHTFTFPIPGNMVVDTNMMGSQVIIPFACTIVKAYANVGTAPTGTSLIFDINYDSDGGVDGGGTTIWATQANRLTVAAGAATANTTTFNTTALVAGGTLTIDIDQIGSTGAGANACVVLVVRKSGTY